MMDHGFFDGPWRGGMSGGKPYIFSDEWRAYLAERKAQADRNAKRQDPAEGLGPKDESAVRDSGCAQEQHP